MLRSRIAVTICALFLGSSAAAQEEGTVPGAIPDPSTYQGSMEMQQQQMRPMMLYMIPSFMLWIFVFPAIFGQTVALSPIVIPYLTCSADNVKNDTPVQTTNSTSTDLKQGPCKVPGQVFLWGWFLLVNFAFSGIIAKVTNTSIPTF